MPKQRLILASQSPRRRQLLEDAGYEFTVITPSDNAEQGTIAGETPTELVQRYATQKAQDVAERLEAEIGLGCVILGCDTVAVCHGKVLGKPRDRSDAKEMLYLMRGNEHSVLSGVCLIPVRTHPDSGDAAEPMVAVDKTVLEMDKVADQQIKEYLDTDLWVGKAGGFGFQDGLNWISIKQGSESNVVGLPMELLARMITDLEARSN